MSSLPIIGGKDCEGVTTTPSHNSTFPLGSITVTGVHTPCHTQDSICFFMQDGDQKAVFTGDTLFIGGCGRFFEGNAEEMHTALNERLGKLPDDTVVYPGHEYTKANMKFGASVLQSEPVKKVQKFADENQVTTGKFTIGDEKVSPVDARRRCMLTRVVAQRLHEMGGPRHPEGHRRKRTCGRHGQAS